MTLDILEVAQNWEADEPKYSALGKIVAGYIKSEISTYEILPEISYRTKDLLSIIKKIKKKLREKAYTYNDLNDKLGLRIICPFKEDMDKVDDFLRKHFEVKKTEYKKDTLDFNKLDYISNHYDVSIKADIKDFKSVIDCKDLIFEIQVRTLNQHAWSNSAHSISYKQEADISPILKRRVYRLLSLYEIADDEFSAVNKALIEHPDNIIYSILRKLESKIYRFAQVDFDRETSLYVLKIVLGFLTKDEIGQIIKEIDGFISDNEEKLKRIFTENRARFYEIPFLTQPEIFLIWFGLEKFSFSIEDNWNNHFDSDELEQIKTLWGKIIN